VISCHPKILCLTLLHCVVWRIFVFKLQEVKEATEKFIKWVSIEGIALGWCNQGVKWIVGYVTLNHTTQWSNYVSLEITFNIIIIFFIDLFIMQLRHNNNNNNLGSTALYGPGPPLFEVTNSCAFVAVGDWSTGRAGVLSILMWPPEPSGRQSGDLGQKWPEFCLRNISNINTHCWYLLCHHTAKCYYFRKGPENNINKWKWGIDWHMLQSRCHLDPLLILLNSLSRTFIARIFREIIIYKRLSMIYMSVSAEPLSVKRVGDWEV
jgi:hypothetical protein